jgi:hypothetical protein
MSHTQKRPPDENVTHTEKAENNPDENVTHTEEVENNQDKEQQAGEINFFETRAITSVLKSLNVNLYRHTLPEIFPKNLTWIF